MVTFREIVNSTPKREDKDEEMDVSSSAQTGPFEVDGDRRDWRQQGGCNATMTSDCDVQPGNRCSPHTIDILAIGACIDYANKRFIGDIGLGHTIHDTCRMFEGETWTCYEYYLDSDTTAGTGDSLTAWSEKWPIFCPSYRFRFCGQNNQILEERFQYYDGEKWVGEATTDDPMIEVALSKNKNELEFSFNSADSLKMVNVEYYTRWKIRIFFAGHAWQEGYWDINGPGFAFVGLWDLTQAEKTNWIEVKSEHK